MLDKEAGMEAIRPYSQRFTRCWWRSLEALSRYKAKLPQDSSRLSSRSEAGMLYDFMKAEVEREFIGSGLRITTRYGRISVSIDGVVTLRFKKFGKNLQTYYSKTQASLDFFELQRPLDGMVENSTNIVSGYRLSQFGSFDGLYYTCPYAGRNAWVIEADMPNEGQGGDTLFVPDSGPTAPVIVPKTSDIPKTAQSEL